MLFKCWEPKVREELMIDGDDPNDAARSFTIQNSKLGQTSMDVHVQDGDKVRKFEMDIEWEISVYAEEIECS